MYIVVFAFRNDRTCRGASRGAGWDEGERGGGQGEGTIGETGPATKTKTKTNKNGGAMRTQYSPLDPSDPLFGIRNAGRENLLVNKLQIIRFATFWVP